MANTGNVEKNIEKAAQDIFVEKGYDGATMREIAARAGINISMLHYYYRSKDNLFDITFNRMFQRMYGRIFKEMSSRHDLSTKIRNIIGIYLDTLSKYPRLPNFLFSEVTRHPVDNGRFTQYKELIHKHIHSFQKQLDHAAEKGEIRPTKAMELFVDIESLCAYPFLTFPLWQKLFDITQTDFTRMTLSRRETFAQNLIKSLEK